MILGQDPFHFIATINKSHQSPESQTKLTRMHDEKARENIFATKNQIVVNQSDVPVCVANVV